MRPTQNDIARLTGLSQATISRALRGDPSVVPETRERILAACRELAYYPSTSARILAEGRRAVIGISLSKVSLPTDRYVSLLHQALTDALDSSGWGVVLLPAGQLEQRLDRVGTVILVSVDEHDPRFAICRAHGVPFVAVGHVAAPDIFSVAPDDAEGGRLVAQHCHRLGRRRLAILSSLAYIGDPAMRLRAEAAEAEAHRLGLETCRIAAVADVTNTLSGYRTVRRQRAALRGADGLFCDTDEHALGALAALRDQGTRVPEDVSVIGFDDLPQLSAGLTTVRQDFAALATAAAALRDDALRGKPARKIVVPVSLIVRDT